jgi:hypothetical protein
VVEFGRDRIAQLPPSLFKAGLLCVGAAVVIAIFSIAKKLLWSLVARTTRGAHTERDFNSQTADIQSLARTAGAAHIDYPPGKPADVRCDSRAAEVFGHIMASLSE